MQERRFRPTRPVDLRLTLAPLRRGSTDPTIRFDASGVWRASRTPEGPATTHSATCGDSVTVRAWGPGAEWALEWSPHLLGADDDDRGFSPRHPLIADLHRRLPALRMCRSAAVVEALVPTVIEQKVVAADAYRAYARMVRALGEPAPGPVALMLPPSPRSLAATPYYAFHRFGLERRRADTLRRVASYARRLEECRSLAPGAAQRRMMLVPGVGPWTAAEVAGCALGNADAVSVGDYHLPHLVSWALAGEPRGDDDRMLELLEPYRGHRGRVIRLLVAGAARPPRYGPKLARCDLTRI